MIHQSAVIDEEMTLFKKSIETFAKKELEESFGKWEEEGDSPKRTVEEIGPIGFTLR
ncbi:hypothetical protein QS257_04865 [Terrilactibacillus sp. S3-3]|nr:hypothetical protein QS257_04865 [Terrilactibacillus sp. S3-3]